MAQLGGEFNAGDVDPAVAFEPLPAGWWAMEIVASEVQQAKSSDGQYLWLELETIETYHPQHKGRKVWARLNLWNANEQAMEIAQRELSAICRAVGEMRVADSEALHHKPLAVKLRVRAAEGQYEASNEISGFDVLSARMGQGGAAAGAPMPPASPPGPPRPPSGPTAPPRVAGPTGAPTAPVGAPPKTPTPPWTR